jgi:hypothetical protein
VSRRGRVRLGLWLWLLAAPGSVLAAQEASLRLEVALDSARAGTRDPVVRTRNLLEDTPWLSTLRQGLPLRLQYRTELWRSRDGWLDELVRQVEWTVVVRHEPLLDQFSVVRFLPPGRILQNRYATPGVLADALGVAYPLRIAPATPGRYYYTAVLEVTTLSESDLDEFERLIRSGLDPRSSGAGSLTDRARRLVLRLAGLPTLTLRGQSAAFEVGS